ncbi:Plg protein (ISS), related, partial [Eimeria tenella]
TSELQRAADRHFCGDSAVVRLMDGSAAAAAAAATAAEQWVCLPVSEEMEFIESLHCVGSCGESMRCLSPKAALLLKGPGDSFHSFVKSKIPPNCSCREGTGGKGYVGCQTRTRLGRECQNWSVQTPHKHEVLQQQNHNFCRAAAGANYIWCFTTDPDLRSDVCDPLGPRTQLVQPGDLFDIVLEGRFAGPHYDIAFFKAEEETGDPCGGPEASPDITVQNAPHSLAKRLFPFVSKGTLAALVWSNVQVKAAAFGAYAVCLCSFSYFLAQDPRCSKPQNYSLHAGWLHVRGPFARKTIFEMEAGEARQVSLGGFGFSKGDSVSVMAADFDCDASVSTFAEAMQSLLSRGPQWQRDLAGALQMGTATAANLEPVSVDSSETTTTLHLPEFTLYNTGVYAACWRPKNLSVSVTAAYFNVFGQPQGDLKGLGGT